MPSYRKVPCILARFDKENKQYIILNKKIKKILGEDFHESEEVRKLVSDFITQKVKYIRKSCTRSSMLTKIFLRRKERHGEGDFETEMLEEGFRVVYYGEE
jgi:hypothetical protein